MKATAALMVWILSVVTQQPYGERISTCTSYLVLYLDIAEQKEHV